MFHQTIPNSSSLQDLIFERHHKTECDELQIISGYIGPEPIRMLSKLPLKASVYYGMYSPGKNIHKTLHDAMRKAEFEYQNLNIFYSNVSVHAKIYLWKNKGEIVDGLTGSANFSYNALTTPRKEILVDLDHRNFQEATRYANFVSTNSISCVEHVPSLKKQEKTESETLHTTPSNICMLTLLDPRTNEVPPKSGLNWGQSEKSHVTPDDAYIAIRIGHIKSNPNLFPPKRGSSIAEGGRSIRENEPVEVIFDDGVSMTCSLEGVNNDPFDRGSGIKYPKQLTSFPEKNRIGKYFRDRLKVPHGSPVLKSHLHSYGRTNVSMTLINEGVYYLDFSNLTERLSEEF